MRSDYGLYSVAIICFIIAIIAYALMANLISGYTLDWAQGITVTVIFFALGVISAAVGYSARPKAVMPKVEPKPAPATPPPPPPTPLPPVEEVAPELPPPPPAPEMPAPAPTPAVTPPPEPKQPVKAAEEEKPKEKPVRRRRKKA